MRYMQAVRINIQVVAQGNFRHQQWHQTATIPHRAALMAFLMSPPSGLYRRVMILVTICRGRSNHHPLLKDNKIKFEVLTVVL